MNIPNMGEWSVNDMMKATALISNVAEMLSAETMLTLMTGDARDVAEINDMTVKAFKDQVRDIREQDGEDAVQQFAHVVKTMATTTSTFMGGLIKALELSGVLIPDPDTVVIPDTVPDDLGGSL